MSKKFEIFLIALIFIFVISLISMQILYKIKLVEPVFQGGNDNAVNYSDSTLYRKRGIIQLKISHYPQSLVLINGDLPINFKQDGEYLIYEVYNKDVIELDLRNVENENVVVYVAAVSDNVTYPKEGATFILKNGIKVLFNISCNNVD